MRKLLVIYFSITFLLIGCNFTSASFQKDADIMRLRHIKYYGELLEQYYQANNKYPFQEKASVPIYIHIANDQQIKYTQQEIPYSHKIVPLKNFIKEIESEIGKSINEYYDPQYAPEYKPNFYIYMIHKDTYFFAVHVHQPFPFSKRIEKNYYKVEISNHPNAQNKAISFEELLNHSKFIEEIKKPLKKEDFFIEREKKYLHYTKRNN